MGGSCRSDHEITGSSRDLLKTQSVGCARTPRVRALASERRDVGVVRAMLPLLPDRYGVRGPAAGIAGVAIPHRQQHRIFVIKQLGQTISLVDDSDVALLEGIGQLGLSWRSVE